MATVQVAPGGNAPDGTKIGDIVVTAGGNYQVVDPNTPGANYNPTNGLWSVKVDGTGTSGGSTAPYVPQGTYNDQGLSSSDQAKIQALKDQCEPENVPALWEEICETHDGTLVDPIPYEGNMALVSGKYYSQDGVTYLCNRDTINPVYNPLRELVGIYVEIVN